MPSFLSDVMLYVLPLDEETHSNNAAHTVHDAMTHIKI